MPKDTVFLIMKKSKKPLSVVLITALIPFPLNILNSLVY
jgi:hypothetical protein